MANSSVDMARTYVGLAAACVLIVGCDRGPTRVELSGKITFKGQPIPAGRIYFNPDFTKSNDGPAGYAEIKNGRYDTRDGGIGACGGPSIVIVNGHAGGADGFGPPLFREYQASVDLPRASGTADFDVPADAAKDPVPAGRKGT